MNKITLVLSIAAVIVGIQNAQAGTAQKQYTLKGSAPTGTLLPTTDARSSIPFDKRYFELSDSERVNYRARFNDISSTEIPPFPRNGLQSIYKPIIAEHKKSARRGSLSLLATVNKNGWVENMEVLNSPSKRLSEVSMAVLKNTKFDPAFCAGAPCAMEFPIEISFQ